MPIEFGTWVIGACCTVFGIVATFAVMKYRIDRNEKETTKTDSEISKRLETHGLKIDEHSEDIRELIVKIQMAPTMDRVRAEFVTKEFFNQHKEHVDRQFNTLNKHIDAMGKQINADMGDIKSLLRERV
uniref:Uncharacterized protein n=1 Tax=Hydrogenovibrio crunogenus (strain DSM 25203 / XCL-2) TaxID=317025 RepID=Q31HV0_HYDCU